MSIATEEISGFLELGMWEEANEVVEALPPEEKTLPEILSLRVRIYFAAGSWELMAEVSHHLTKIDPSQSAHWLNYSQATIYVDGLPLALEILKQAEKRFPDDAGVLYTLALRESTMGLIEEAKAHLNAAIRLDPRYRQNALDDPELNALWDDFTS